MKALASGSWVEPPRIRAIAAMSAVTTCTMIAYLFWGSHGTIDAWGRPIGTDFSNVWTAGRMALDGNAVDAWDWPRHHAVQQTTHSSRDVPFYGWHYPPPFLLIASCLAMIPYIPALVLWQVSTFGLALHRLAALLPGRTTVVAALGAPVTFICLTHGHNGFLTAALLCGGLAMLDRRPLLAGILLGCMIYKPQFGLVLPVVLLAGGHYRAIAGAMLAAGLLVVATLIAFDSGVWVAFVHSLPLTQSVIIEQGAAGWEKIQSAFSAARWWGASVGFAWGIQTLVAVAAVLSAAFVARGVKSDVRNAVVVAAALLSTPYVLDYDLVPLSLSIAFMVRDGRARGFLTYEKSLLALVWGVPLVGRVVFQATGLPIDLISMMAMAGLALRRASVFDRSWVLDAGSRIAARLPAPRRLV